MDDPSSGFHYNTIRETDLCDYDISSIKETDLTTFDFDVDTMNELNKNNADHYIREIKETDLTGDDGDKIRETDLTGNEEDQPNSKNNSFSYNNSSIKYQPEEDGDSEQWKLDTVDSVCLSTDSGIMNDNKLFELDSDEDSTVTFQDLQSDFFETDCDEEATDVEKSFETNHGETRDIVRFQDIESDFFETDCEGGDMDSSPKENVQFQDIESDFFDEDEECISTIDKTTKILPVISKSNQNSPPQAQSELISKLASEKDRRASMTNNLLRSTIDELERALTNSNLLLANRDQKIQDLRKRNLELKKGLTEELEISAQLKLLMIEKDSVISEKETQISEIQTELKKISIEISDLRLYKLNNIHKYDFPSSSYNPINLDCSTETDLLDDTIEDPNENINKKQTHHNAPFTKRTHSCSEKTYKQQSEDTQQNKTTCPLSRSKSHVSEQPRCTRSKQDDKDTIKNTTTSPSINTSIKQNGSVDAVSSTELHARLQMKFMRDAFFYYMIGFHSDEQINAILAILNYGDKRQDFVLEAHKLKKSGKKFNVSKVSSRGLSFIQSIKDV